MNFNTDKRNLGSCFKLSLLMLSLSLLGLAGSCQSGTPTTVDIDLGNTGFFQDSNPDTTERTYSFFAGTNNDSFTLNLQPTGLSATSRIIALAGDGSTVTTITSPAATSVTFPGNVGFLRLASDGLGPSLGMTISAVTLNADGN